MHRTIAFLVLFAASCPAAQPTASIAPEGETLVSPPIHTHGLGLPEAERLRLDRKQQTETPALQ